VPAADLLPLFWCDVPELVVVSDVVTVLVVIPASDGQVVAADRAVLAGGSAPAAVCGERTKIAAASWGAVAVTGLIATDPTSLDAVAAIEVAASLGSGSHALSYLCSQFDEHADRVRNSDGAPFVGLAATVGQPVLTMAVVVERTPGRVLRTQAGLTFRGAETSYYKNAPAGPLVVTPPDAALSALFEGVAESHSGQHSSVIVAALDGAFASAAVLTGGRVTADFDWHLV
jgi:hypothetical protein